MKKIVNLLAGLAIFPVVASGAGGTSSGGGNSINNVNNPWFLENTASVSYCIEIDEPNMGITYAKALEKTNQALKFWKQGFAASKNDHFVDGELHPYGQIRIATQRFNLVQCDSNTDLRFQFGILTEDQVSDIGNPRDYIGISIRTQYDKVNLRGKGYIYIAPKSGNFRPDSNQFAAEPWSVCNSCLLEAVLKHELGHVFGLKHSDARENSLMEANVPAYASSKESVLRLPRDQRDVEFFTRRNHFTIDLETVFLTKIDGDETIARELFALTPEEKFLKIIKEPRDDHDRSSFNIYASQNSDRDWVKIGNMCWEKQWGSSSRAAVEVFLGSEQAVFTSFPTRRYYGTLPAHSISEDFEFSGSLCSDRGAERKPLLISGWFHGPRFIGSMNKFRMDTQLIDQRKPLENHFLKSKK